MRLSSARCSGVVVHADDAALHGFAAEHGRVDREVAALRVPAHAQRRPGEGGGRRLEIRHRLGLRRHRVEETHVEVLFPADERVVGAAEGNVDAAVVQLQRDGGELQLGLRVNLVDITGKPQAAEARAVRHAAHELRDLARYQHAHLGRGVGREVAVGGGLERRGRCERGRGEAAEVEIGQLRKEQVVHLVEGAFGQRQIAAPAEIVENIGHGASSCSFFPIIHKNRAADKRKWPFSS